MSLRICFAVSRALSCSTAMLIFEGEQAYASDPLPQIFKDWNARRIAQEAEREHFSSRLKTGMREGLTHP